MGRPKVTIIDDSQPEIEVKNKKAKKESKLESVKASDAVEPITEQMISTDETGAKQISSEASGEPSDALRPSETVLKKKTHKPGKAKPRSKKYQEITQDLDRSKAYSLNDAVEEVKKLSYSKFTGTLEIHINTIQTGLRGLVSLPFVSGKKLKILAFGPQASSGQAKELEETGVIIGDEEKIAEIGKDLPAGKAGKIDFDLVVTTPEWMPKLAKVAKNLGPRGLMPSPKNGTIADDLKKAIESFQAGKTEYKTEAKGKVIHLGLGKLSQPTEELSANVKTLLQTLGKTKTQKVSLSPTMGPSVKLDLASI